jgi:hypothetical protein
MRALGIDFRMSLSVVATAVSAWLVRSVEIVGSDESGLGTVG